MRSITFFFIALFSSAQAMANITLKDCVEQGKIALRSRENEITGCADACAEFKKTIPKDWFQDSLEVPENHADPEGKKINVFYYGKLAPGTTPVVYFNGGPGADSHSAFRKITKKQIATPAYKKLSFIFIDQRGNGCSSFYPQGVDAQTLERMSHYGSTGIVNDAELVRKKILQNKRWIAFGQSYGGFITHRYYTLFPDSLLAGVSHGNSISLDGYQRFKLRIRSQLKLKNEYLKTYPKDAKIFEMIATQADLKQCVPDIEEINEDYCGYDAFYGIMSNMGFRNEWDWLHKWMIDLQKEGTEDLDWDYVADFLSENADYVNPYNKKNIVNRVLFWTDRNMVRGDLKDCTRIRSEILADEAIDIALDPLNECSAILQAGGSMEDSLAPYKHLDQDVLKLSDLKASLLSHPGVPFKLYSGELDPFLPKEVYADELLATKGLLNLTYTHFMKTGHDGYLTEEKVWQDLLQIRP